MEAFNNRFDKTLRLGEGQWDRQEMDLDSHKSGKCFPFSPPCLIPASASFPSHFTCSYLGMVGGFPGEHPFPTLASWCEVILHDTVGYRCLLRWEWMEIAFPSRFFNTYPFCMALLRRIWTTNLDGRRRCSFCKSLDFWIPGCVPSLHNEPVVFWESSGLWKTQYAFPLRSEFVLRVTLSLQVLKELAIFRC